MRYILNSAVITSEGRYTYRLVTADEARSWLDADMFASTIGYQETCDALFALTGRRVGCNRRQVSMQAGDEALVFRLTVRLQDPALKGRIGDLEFIRQNSEVGILRKEA